MFHTIRSWFRSPPDASKRRKRRMLAFDVLEGRITPNGYRVDTGSDDDGADAPGQHTLRWVLTDLEANGGNSNSIGFASDITGITLHRELPPIGHSVDI